MKSWGSFFWGFLFGVGTAHSAGCTVELPICHYERGPVLLHLEDPTGAHEPSDSLTTVELQGVRPCTHDVSQDDGTQLHVSCEPGNPVRACSLVGICADSEDGHLFNCQGSVEFQ